MKKQKPIYLMVVCMLVFVLLFAVGCNDDPNKNDNSGENENPGISENPNENDNPGGNNPEPSVPQDNTLTVAQINALFDGIDITKQAAEITQNDSEIEYVYTYNLVPDELPKLRIVGKELSTGNMLYVIYDKVGDAYYSFNKYPGRTKYDVNKLSDIEYKIAIENEISKFDISADTIAAEDSLEKEIKAKYGEDAWKYSVTGKTETKGSVTTSIITLNDALLDGGILYNREIVVTFVDGAVTTTKVVEKPDKQWLSPSQRYQYADRVIQYSVKYNGVESVEAPNASERNEVTAVSSVSIGISSDFFQESVLITNLTPGDVYTLPDYPTVNGYEGVGYYYNRDVNKEVFVGKAGDEIITPYANCSLVAVYKAVNGIAVTYYDGNKKIAEIEYPSGTPISQLDIQTNKYGYSSNGWYLNAEFNNDIYTSTDTLSAPIALYAKFVANPIVTFSAEGIDYKIPKKIGNYLYENELAQIERNGYVFVCWCKDEELQDELEFNNGSCPVDEDCTLYAKYEEGIVVTLDNGGCDGQFPNQITIAKLAANASNEEKENALAALLEVLNAYGIKFESNTQTCAGWSTSATENVELTEYPATAITLYPQFVNTYVITFDNSLITMNSAYNGQKDIEWKKLFDKTKFDEFYEMLIQYSDYLFEGIPADKIIENFYTDSACTTVWNAWPTKDVTIYSKLADKNIFKIEAGDGEFNGIDVEIDMVRDNGSYYDFFAQMTSAITPPANKEIEGFYSDSAFTSPIVVSRNTAWPKSNVTVFVKYKDAVIVTVKVGSDGFLSNSDMSGSKTLKEIKSNYGSYADFISELNQVTQPVNYDEKDFYGWYLDSDFGTEATGTEPTESVTLYAKFAAPQYVAFIISNATLETMRYRLSELKQNPFYDNYSDFIDYIVTQIVVDDGYMIDGIYGNADYTQKLDSNWPTEDTDLYVKIIDYVTVSVNLGDGRAYDESTDKDVSIINVVITDVSNGYYDALCNGILKYSITYPEGTNMIANIFTNPEKTKELGDGNLKNNDTLYLTYKKAPILTFTLPEGVTYRKNSEDNSEPCIIIDTCDFDRQEKTVSEAFFNEAYYDNYSFSTTGYNDVEGIYSDNAFTQRVANDIIIPDKDTVYYVKCVCRPVMTIQFGGESDDTSAYYYAKDDSLMTTKLYTFNVLIKDDGMAFIDFIASTINNNYNVEVPTGYSVDLTQLSIDGNVVNYETEYPTTNVTVTVKTKKNQY